MDVGQSEALKFFREPLRGFRVSGGTDDPAPELRMPLIAIVARDRRQIFDVSMNALAVDRCIGFASFGELPLEKRVVELVQRRRGNLRRRPGSGRRRSLG